MAEFGAGKELSGAEEEKDILDAPESEAREFLDSMQSGARLYLDVACGGDRERKGELERKYYRLPERSGLTEQALNREWGTIEVRTNQNFRIDHYLDGWNPKRDELGPPQVVEAIVRFTEQGRRLAEENPKLRKSYEESAHMAIALLRSFGRTAKQFEDAGIAQMAREALQKLEAETR